jgi:hypothetical protein
MAKCTIQRGYTESCKDFQGGIDKVYLFPYVKYGVADITFGGFSKGQNPNAQNITSFPNTTIYEYEAVNISYTENATITSGGIEWAQDLSFTLPRSFEALNAFKLMYQDYCAIILDRNGNYRIIGLWNGGEVTINAGTGGEKNAMNGSTISLKAREDNQAYFLNNFDRDFTIFNNDTINYLDFYVTGTDFEITTGGGTFLYDVTTDDGYTATGLTGDHTIEFPVVSLIHKVSISGVFPAFDFSSNLDKVKIKEISNFGIYGLGSTSQDDAFEGCTNLTITATDGGNFKNVTSLQQAFMSCGSLTNFPYIDTGKVESFSATWRYCTALTDFPLLDFSSGNNFNSAWVNCSSLKHFPANAFDNCTATNFTDAFFNTNLSEQSIDGILESIDFAGQINGTFTQSGGEAPSSVGLAVKTSLEAKGWNISVTT